MGSLIEFLIDLLPLESRTFWVIALPVLILVIGATALMWAMFVK